MSSTLTWIDHDAAARERSLRILSLFQEKESRDELGLGGVRDSFADQLFPGTSTIQTRLRYMLIVPWIYRSLEDEHVRPEDFASRADRMERDLVQPLLASDDRSGVFGKTAGRALKRLPSSVYWAGLGSWGIRLIDASQDQYHRHIGAIYRRRAEQISRQKERAKVGDDSEAAPDPATLTWHPRLPVPPDGFPDELNLALTSEEAGFLLDRIQRSHPDSLLAHLALNCEPVEVAAPWLHPDLGSFRSDHLDLLAHAQRFSEVMHGAALLYNVLLTQERSWNEKVEEHTAAFEAWTEALELGDLRDWAMPELWQHTLDHGHTITAATRRFIERWVAMVVRDPDGILADPSARDLVRRREMSLKGTRSRFKNRRALDQWGGSSGVGRLVYRWPTATTFLRDLHAGLQGGAS